MGNKRVISLIILFAGIFFCISLASLASAQGYLNIDLKQGANQVINLIVDFAEPFLQILLGGGDYTGLLLFERFLLFILFLSLIYLSLKNIGPFEDTPAVLWIVSIVVPLIAIRFIDYEWLNAILTQYQILGIAVLGIFPFIIYLFFLYNTTETLSENSIVRKIGWIFFIVIYFGLWSTNKTNSYSRIYFWTMLVAVAFLLLDGTINRLFENQRYKEAGREGIYKRIAELDKDLKTMENATSIPQRKKDKLIQGIIDEKNKLIKMLRKM